MNGSNPSPWNPCPSSPYGVQTFFAVETLNLLFGVPANVWTAWCCCRRSVQASEVFTLNLALLEVVYGSLSFLRPLNYYIIRSNFLYHFSLFFYGLLSAGRPLFQAFICLERYAGVVHPVAFLRWNSVGLRVRGLPVLWALVLVFCLCNVFQLVLVFPAVFLLLLLLQGFCCIRMLQVLRQAAPGNGDRKRSDPDKRQAFISVLVIQVMMVLNYLPTVLAVPLRGHLSRHGFLCQLIPAALSCSVFCSFIQPVLFLMRTWRTAENT